MTEVHSVETTTNHLFTRAFHMHTDDATLDQTIAQAWRGAHAIVASIIRYSSSYSNLRVLTGVHEIHDQMYSNEYQITILLVVDLPSMIINLLYDDLPPSHNWQIAYNFVCPNFMSKIHMKT